VRAHLRQLVIVELGQQTDDLADRQLVVVLDGEEDIVVVDVFGRVTVTASGGAQALQLADDLGAVLTRGFALFHHVELVGVQLRQQRQDLVDGELVVVGDRELDLAFVPIGRRLFPLLIGGEPLVALGFGRGRRLCHHRRRRHGRKRGGLVGRRTDGRVLRLRHRLGLRHERSGRTGGNRLRFRHTDSHEQDDGSSRAETDGHVNEREPIAHQQPEH